MSLRKNQKPRKKTEVQARAEAGHISCPALPDGSLRFNIPKEYSVGKKKQTQRRLGLKKTPENRAIADLITAHLNERIRTEDYDPEKLDEYINKYKLLYLGYDSPPPLPSRRPNITKSKTSRLDELWEGFCQQKAITIKETTFKIVFSTVGSHISKLKTKNLDEADIIIAELRQQIESDSAFHRTLSFFSNCCDWAVDEDKISKNPFKLTLRGLKAPQTDADPDPFTREGMIRVLAAYEKHPRYCHYYPFIKFRFKTGCRIAEAVALKWKHVHWKEGYIKFCETITSIGTEFVHRKGTKTEPSRKFPLRASLRQFLEAHKPSDSSPEDYVFSEPKGGHIEYFNLRCSWRGRTMKRTMKDGTEKLYHYEGIVSGLAELPEEEGGIDHYRPPYSPRHTFITLALDKLARKKEVKLSDVAQLADYLGTSTKMIFENYLGKSGDDSIVDIDEDETDSALIDHFQETSQPSTAMSAQILSAQQLIEQLTQQLGQLTQQNQFLQQHITQLLSFQMSTQPANSFSQSSEQLELVSPSESDLDSLALLLTMSEQIQADQQHL